MTARKTLLFTLALTGVAGLTPLSAQDAAEAAKKILESFNAGRYEEGNQLAADFIKANPQSPNLPSAYLLQARSLYNLSKWPEAIAAYGKVAATAPEKDVKEEAVYFIAQSAASQADAAPEKSPERKKGFEDALQKVAAFLKDYPESSSRAEAFLLQSRINLLLGKYAESSQALDEARKAEILPYLERLRDELGLPILYVSHSVAEVARLATSIVLLEAGRVVTAGPAAQVMADPAMAPVMGLREAGALISARVVAHEADGLTRLDSAGGPLWLPRLGARPGDRLRLRILAQDVMLATARPDGISALNILSTVIEDIRLGDGPGALVRLRLGDEALLARITRRSVEALGLQPGKAVFAVLKSVSVAQDSVGADAGTAPT